MDSYEHHDARPEDITAAAAWLKSRYPALPIVSSGRSYGGMHTLASMIADPYAFNLFVAEMPVADVIEFRENGAFGGSASDDFGFTHNPPGDLRSTTDHVESLKAWSPAQRAGVLATNHRAGPSGDRQDGCRVEPDQARRMALALEERPGMAEQVYLREEPTGSHDARTAVDSTS